MGLLELIGFKNGYCETGAAALGRGTKIQFCFVENTIPILDDFHYSILDTGLVCPRKLSHSEQKTQSRGSNENDSSDTKPQKKIKSSTKVVAAGSVHK